MEGNGCNQLLVITAAFIWRGWEFTEYLTPGPRIEAWTHILRRMGANHLIVICDFGTLNLSLLSLWK
jgi:hypothetical protein